MSSKKKQKHDPDVLVVQGRKDQDEAEAIAEAALRPEFQATVTVREYVKKFGNVSMTGLVTAMQETLAATEKGDLGRGEAMLTAQAHTLDAIYNNLARRAINADFVHQLDTYLKLALRAQSQCRATWEALSAIKNPPVAGYVGQANIAHGPQQVVNGRQTEAGSPRAGENENPQNELLETLDDERLDTGTQGTSGADNQAMATVGKVNRSEDD